jgi:GT2 family glycosyltransferase
MSTLVRIAVLIAVHNRWEMTSKLLSTLKTVPTTIQLCVHLVDDGSSDRTPLELAKLDDITCLRGEGDLFWARSMKFAQDSVTDPVDYFLWLNNDVDLSHDFFSRLLESIREFPSVILVGQASDLASQRTTYGGLKRIGRHPHRLQMIQAQARHESADTFCGNIVLIPNAINHALRGIDGEFQHGFADYDFGYRATNMGYQIRIIPGFLGKCSPNRNPFESLTRGESIKLLMGKKYLPVRSQIRFCKRHGGLFWPLYFFAPYLRVVFGTKPFRVNQRSTLARKVSALHENQRPMA